MVARVLAVVLSLAFVAGCGGDDEPPKASTENPLVGELRDGGLTLVIRHATADAEIAKQEKLSSCELQRNLTEAGKQQAREIASGIKALEIPIGDVRSSPMCRTHDTAEIAFGRVTDDEDLVSPGVIGTEAGDKRRAEALRQMVMSPPEGKKNTVLVTHTGNIGTALGEETVAEGETLVYDQRARLAGRVKADEWARLAAGEVSEKEPAPSGGGY